MNKLKENKDYFIISFIGGVFALTVIVLLSNILFLYTGLIIVLGGSLIFSLILGSLLILTNMFIRPRIQKYFIEHKSLEGLGEIGLNYDDKYKGYIGEYRNYNLQVLCSFDRFSLISSEYVINIFFQRVDFETIDKNRIGGFGDYTKISDFFIQNSFQFKLKPPSSEVLIEDVNRLIDIIEEKELKPISLGDINKEIEKEINGVE